MYQQLSGYKVEEKLYLGVREQKRLNTTALKETNLWKGQRKGEVKVRDEDNKSFPVVFQRAVSSYNRKKTGMFEAFMNLVQSCLLDCTAV
jgi:hypothetical protein